MTREEAIQILSTRDAHGVLCGYTSGVTEALDMAIESLSAPSGELISRADAIKAVSEAVAYGEGFIDVLKALEALPSAEAKTKCVAQINVDTEEVVTRIKKEHDKVLNGYMEWLEKIIVEAETFEWLCEDNTDEEWCEKNCDYASIQAECLRHIYEVSKGGDTE